MKKSKRSPSAMCNEVSSTSDTLDTNPTTPILRVSRRNPLRTQSENNDNNQPEEQDNIRQRLRPRDKLKKRYSKPSDDESNEDYVTEEIQTFHDVTLKALAQNAQKFFKNHLFKSINTAKEANYSSPSNFHMGYEYMENSQVFSPFNTTTSAEESFYDYYSEDPQPSTSGLQSYWSKTVENVNSEENKPKVLKQNFWEQLDVEDVEKDDPSVFYAFKTVDASDTDEKTPCQLNILKTLISATESLANTDLIQTEFVDAQEESGTNDLPKEENIEKQDSAAFNNNKINTNNEICDQRLYDLDILNTLIAKTFDYFSNNTETESEALKDTDDEENYMSEDLSEKEESIDNTEKQDSKDLNVETIEE